MKLNFFVYLCIIINNFRLGKFRIPIRNPLGKLYLKRKKQNWKNGKFFDAESRHPVRPQIKAEKVSYFVRSFRYNCSALNEKGWEFSSRNVSKKLIILKIHFLQTCVPFILKKWNFSVDVLEFHRTDNLCCTLFNSRICRKIKEIKILFSKK